MTNNLKSVNTQPRQQQKTREQQIKRLKRHQYDYFYHEGGLPDEQATEAGRWLRKALEDIATHGQLTGWEIAFRKAWDASTRAWDDDASCVGVMLQFSDKSLLSFAADEEADPMAVCAYGSEQDFNNRFQSEDLFHCWYNVENEL